MKITWSISDLKSKADTKVVVNVTAVVSFELDGYRDRAVRGAKFEGDPTSPSFIPFENLTEEIVIGWVKEQLGPDGIADMEDNVKKRIEENIQSVKKPQFISKIPWKNR